MDDSSFKKPGAIPFQWEIRPGVPKLKQPTPRSTSPSHHLRHSLLQHHQLKQKENHNSLSSGLLRLSPPPSGFNFPTPEPEYKVRSSRSAPRTRLSHDRIASSRPEVVESGCFAGSLIKNTYKKRTVGSKPKSRSEPDYGSDLGSLSSRSESTRKSTSLFSDSPFSSSFSSYQSSPCLFSDPEWVGFGLF